MSIPTKTNPNAEAERPPSYTPKHAPGVDETKSSSTNIVNYSKRPSPPTSHLCEFCQYITGFMLWTEPFHLRHLLLQMILS